MLSTVSIDAAGTTGEEILVVTANGAEVFNTNVSTNVNTFTFDVDNSLSVSDLRINFVNDFFDPGVTDRNLIVEEIRFNGNRFDPAGLNVFSTGTFLNEDGVQPGFGRGNTLHTNGFFEVTESNTFEFNGNVWNTSRALSSDEIRIDTEFNELVLSGSGVEDFVLSRQIDIVAGELSVLSVDAYRNVISGSFNGAAAGAGIDFFDLQGNKIRSLETLDIRPFELNDNATDPSDRIQENQFRVPSDATTAFLYIFVEGSDQATNITLRLTDLSLEPATLVGDTQAPTARVSTVSAARGTFFVFSVTLGDETALPADPNVIASANAIELVDPEGRIITPTFDSTTQFGSTSQSVTFLVNGNSIGAPNLLVDGEYEARLIGGTVRTPPAILTSERLWEIWAPLSLMPKQVSDA